MVSCVGGLPPSLEREIHAENERQQAAVQQVQHSQEQVRHDLAQAADLFQNASAPAQWTITLRDAREKLDRARDESRELTRLTHPNREDAQARARRLLAEERRLREAAVEESQTVEATADKWLEFRRHLPASLEKMSGEYQAIRNVDLAPVATTVQRAERDWPAKKTALDSQLTALHEIPSTAETQWRALEPARQAALAGKATGAQLATLIEEDDTLAQQRKTLAAAPAEITAHSGQLYDSWDKILTDLDAGHSGQENTFYRERIKTVRTHFTDVAAKTTETHSDEHWRNVSEPAFHAVEGDIGMAIAHKDAGLFDSEAQETPQPAGFAYVASPAQGSNQYGYWSHSGGASVWTFLPEYLIMRELLWNHDYRPVATGEYNAYRAAQRNGASYYGQETPASPPKYGSHGTFTQTHYADSRYVQSGGFKGSAYASNRGANSHADPHGGAAPADNNAGHRFGRAPGSPPSGERFGRAGGFHPSGRSFGRRR